MGELASLLPFPIHVYGVLLALAFAGGIGVALHLCERSGISRDQIIDLAIVFMFSAIAGSRILYIILYPQQFRDVWSLFALNRGGLVFYGGFVATALAVVAFGRRQGISLRLLGDVIAPSLAMGHTIGRLGCFANGCCYGAPSGLPWACRFPAAGDALARHPTQLYEALFLFAALLVTFRLASRAPGAGRPRAGFIWGGY
ncbi:MAG TPA: prolipoprotein diacylglyceryl transferase, partial [Candidatus Ozemobacteraceae bacterium]|nr:prolipoprotein diacylglyceryl transferase [Candidatus Ozemobacteraceae bacterium]